MFKNKILASSILTLFSPFFALPFFFLLSLIIAFDHPPGIQDPLRDELGAMRYNFRWSLGAAIMTALLNLNSLIERFYFSLPILLAGNYALTYAFPSIRQRLMRNVVILLAAGFYFFVVSYGGLWLGLWEMPIWT